MARPQKDPTDLRKRWDALYVTPAERAAVKAAAAEAGLSASQYLLSLHMNGHVTNRDDWRRSVQLLTVVTQQLDVIARSSPGAEGTVGTPLQSLEIARSLLNLERWIRDQVMPWTAVRRDCNQDDNGGDAC
ncbi:plasmid mobilization protein [Marivita sp. S0852]|uniref:plasmid mobilization protein n=1 Tax=Marivita sp. S0852 TaxID=3373893 RepID=UPI0039827A62